MYMLKICYTFFILADKTCPEDQFSCGNGSKCIPKMWVCDEQSDCPNNADEKDCGTSSCQNLWIVLMFADFLFTFLA